MIANQLMCESQIRFVILHLASVLFANILVTIYAKPLVISDIVGPEGILVISLVFIIYSTYSVDPRIKR